ncbi:piggyBac transposable element-derived protein 4-like [Gigantopelta aegis]|uniref:piggyBac transposable element-derived protein 4-like n=1 Tax=Gigantopelta aegis TaxID=1735272 RepID=UPI001B88C12B|nr:piggyBac transposable element-derived protein 4-like [Gigantopelta aegis]
MGEFIPFFHDVLPRNRFEEIFWMLHLQEDTTSTRLRRIDKVKPLLDQLLTTFQSVFYPGREISVDETMVGFKGRVGFRQYCPLKPIKWGLKSFVLADSATGFILNIIPYTGVRQRTYICQIVNPELPSLTQIVWLLLKIIFTRVIIFMLTGLYSSVPLVDELESV